MKDEARVLWHWMLKKSLFFVALILNTISFLLVSAAMMFVRWLTKH